MYSPQPLNLTNDHTGNHWSAGSSMGILACQSVCVDSIPVLDDKMIVDLDWIIFLILPTAS
jgi:hypothetical protein